jgi:hypothetical protein
LLKASSVGSHPLKTIKIPWSSKLDNIPKWDEVSIKIVQTFGLPGHKYRCEMSTEAMIYHFENEQDCFLCKLMVSEYL